ncbi:hypothetical protein SAMN05216404_10746 [Nitrosospira multiformis]|uniref:Uncharacterized protein n=1 Tax=Nitrosospira multiformis TaxID=1231 RepID=A0A1H8JDF2_9PROT|nr:hypothetical protein SAMN05216404_10746 [Nitrosospira multiformis]
MMTGQVARRFYQSGKTRSLLHESERAVKWLQTDCYARTASGGHL